MLKSITIFVCMHSMIVSRTFKRVLNVLKMKEEQDLTRDYE